jgi:hypothetical protein
MVRIILSAVALAGILAAAQPAFADPLAATPSDRVQTTVVAREQPAASVPAATSSPDARSQANGGLGKDAVTVGFGWG